MNLDIRYLQYAIVRMFRNTAPTGFRNYTIKLRAAVKYEAMIITDQTIAILLILASSQSGSGSLCYGTACDYKNCTTDYFTLERAVLDNHDNVFKLATTFFPSHKNNPLYLTVKYSSPNCSSEYVWSTATLYHIIHPRIIRYLSLLFYSVEDERIEDLELKIPKECSNLTLNKKSDNTNFLRIFTQRVGIYSKHNYIHQEYG